MASALIGLGSNLGDRPAQLTQALQLLCAGGDCSLVRRSRWYRTPSVGGPAGQPAFLNGAAVIETSLSPRQLHKRLLSVEAQLGRQRDVRWGPRTVDLDLLLYGTQVIQSPELIVPHPRMNVRRFVLVPAAEIAADWLHPSLGWTLGRLAGHFETAAPYLAITGPPGSGKTALAEALAESIGARLVRNPVIEPLIGAIDNAASRGLPIEEQLTESRRQALAVIEPGPAVRIVSDFWLGQSLAFAHAFLPAEQAAEFSRWWEQTASQAARPKLLVALDAPGDQLWRRLLERGQADELSLDVPQLEDLRSAFAQQWSRPWGPILQLPEMSHDEALAELRAATAAMDVACVGEPE